MSLRPRAAGPSTGWWFPWQIWPKGARASDAKSRKKNPTARARRMGAVKREHRKRYGEWCPGWGLHAAHDLAPSDRLTVHHIIPLHKGGPTRGDNIVIVCHRGHKQAHRGGRP
jgi:hypothetical protein